MAEETRSNESIESSDSPVDPSSGTIGTPEGDNEFAPGQPLAPTPNAVETPSGSAPDGYKADKTPEDKPSGLEKFIDEVARGEYM